MRRSVRSRSRLGRLLVAALVALGPLGTLAACKRGHAAALNIPAARDPGPRPDEMPSLIGSELPFRYPAALYARRAQGNVTLRLYVDRDGRVVADSTRVDSTSGIPAFDSAAVSGARDLRFVPAKLHGEAVAVTMLFPVYFRHPEARPLPGDSALAALRRGSS